MLLLYSKILYKRTSERHHPEKGRCLFCIGKIERKGVSGHGMTARQERFCQEFIASGNATQSAIKAGYSDKNAKTQGARLLMLDEVKQRIKELQTEVKNDKILDAIQMQEVLTSIILKESEEEVIVVEGCGDGISEAVTKTKTASNQDRIRAIQLLARMQGALDNTATVNVVLPVFGGEDDLEE
nr:MAG: Terminase small subunit [Bacteriophage sp.]